MNQISTDVCHGGWILALADLVTGPVKVLILMVAVLCSNRCLLIDRYSGEVFVVSTWVWMQCFFYRLVCLQTCAMSSIVGFCDALQMSDLNTQCGQSLTDLNPGPRLGQILTL